MSAAGENFGVWETEIEQFHTFRMAPPPSGGGAWGGVFFALGGSGGGVFRDLKIWRLHPRRGGAIFSLWGSQGERTPRLRSANVHP